MSEPNSFDVGHVCAVGIIPDGSRRWALTHRVSYQMAYQRSIDAFCSLVPALLQYFERIEHVAVYVFSIKNLQRDSHDVEAILDAAALLCGDPLRAVCEEHAFAVRIVSTIDLRAMCRQTRIRLAAERFLSSATALEHNTASYKKRGLYLIAGYDPLAEINASVQKNGQAPVEVRDLAVPVHLDLVIRTANEHRLSAFLPFQCAYAELMTLPEYFPDISAKSAERVLAMYQAAQARAAVVNRSDRCTNGLELMEVKNRQSEG